MDNAYGWYYYTNNDGDDNKQPLSEKWTPTTH